MFAVHIVQGSSRSNSTRKKSGLFSGIVRVPRGLRCVFQGCVQRVELGGRSEVRQSHMPANSARGSESVKAPCDKRRVVDLPHSAGAAFKDSQMGVDRAASHFSD